ncbi:hypothetical protein PG997_015180 [Apiospora hydei]|uniref:Uncharacterized protein n=1 Tax=Apiospora hydei TaxID=1337664 RepID=A0ABR1UVY0_9PEZI
MQPSGRPGRYSRLTKDFADPSLPAITCPNRTESSHAGSISSAHATKEKRTEKADTGYVKRLTGDGLWRSMIDGIAFLICYAESASQSNAGITGAGSNAYIRRDWAQRSVKMGVHPVRIIRDLIMATWLQPLAGRAVSVTGRDWAKDPWFNS